MLHSAIALFFTFENGILKSYMIDKLNARRMGMKVTGSGRKVVFAL